MDISLKKHTGSQLEATRLNDVNDNWTTLENDLKAIQGGSVIVNLTSGAGNITVTFPVPYPTTPPYVAATPVIGTSLGNKLNFGIRNITKTGFDIVCERDTGYTTLTFHWIAIPR